jgi:3,4-dihydroxy 2-butanone 4-phosphate synthase/GTP cyclohydrolase II
MEEAGQGLTAVIAWQGDRGPETEAPAREAKRHGQLESLALERGLLLEREEHPRVLALLNRPVLAVLLAAPAGGQLTLDDLALSLQVMAAWSGTAAVSLLLAPDAQRTGHPSVDLEPVRRPISELRENPTTVPHFLSPGTFMVWS